MPPAKRLFRPIFAPLAPLRAALADVSLVRYDPKYGCRGYIVPPIALIALVLCCACAARAPSPSASYRAVQSPIYSTAALPMARLAGQWRQVGGFGAAKPCAAAPVLTITATPQGAAQAQFDLCLGAQRVQGGGAVASAGAQGRYLLAGLPAPIWVLWIDEGNRSMALGTPDGRFGMILSKDPIPADRLRAARAVLAWNGYDLTQFYQYLGQIHARGNG